MKKLTKPEAREYLIKYLAKKGINLSLNEYNNLIWIYKSHYSEFIIKIYIEPKDGWSDESGLIIKYYSSYAEQLGRRKTAVTDGFGLKVYKNLIFIKEQLDKRAEQLKETIDRKKKYCTELEIYYKKIHKRVEISTSKNRDESISININAYDDNKSTSYSMTYKDNRYYLNGKYTNSEIEFEVK